MSTKLLFRRGFILKMIDSTLVTRRGLIQQRHQQSFLQTTICVAENSSNHGDQMGIDAVIVTTVVW